MVLGKERAEKKDLLRQKRPQCPHGFNSTCTIQTKNLERGAKDWEAKSWREKSGKVFVYGPEASRSLAQLRLMTYTKQAPRGSVAKCHSIVYRPRGE